jgi:hypothetical protein
VHELHDRVVDGEEDFERLYHSLRLSFAFA